MRRPLLPLALLSSLLLAACNREAPARPANPPPPATAIVPPVVPAGETSAANEPPPSVPTDIVATPSPREEVEPREVDQHEDLPRPGDEAEGPGDTGFDADGEERLAAAPHWSGVAGIRFGMPADEVRDRWRGELGDYGVGDDDSCFYLAAELRRPADSPALMFVSGRFVRYDVDAPGLRAPGGGAVGMDSEQILERYGEERIERRPHKYTDGEYLRIDAPDGGSVLLFETDEEGVVTEWRIGVEPQVDYVEGCS